jgi:uncharacterized protein (DUF2147 family)
MRVLWSAFPALLLCMPAWAAEGPTGEWLVTDGYAHIRIEDCGGRMWGVVSSEQKPGGIDQYNPDPAKRTRPTLGMPVILGMQPAQPNRWEGEIYNSENGKTYTGRIILTSPDVLRVEGCVLGFLCGGQNWTRVKAEQPTVTSSAPRKSTEAPRKSAEAPAPRRAADARKPAEAALDVCSTVGAGTTGSAHQRRLK